jgi:hypothetical protein
MHRPGFGHEAELGEKGLRCRGQGERPKDSTSDVAMTWSWSLTGSLGVYRSRWRRMQWEKKGEEAASGRSARTHASQTASSLVDAPWKGSQA